MPFRSAIKEVSHGPMYLNGEWRKGIDIARFSNTDGAASIVQSGNCIVLDLTSGHVSIGSGNAFGHAHEYTVQVHGMATQINHRTSCTLLSRKEVRG